MTDVLGNKSAKELADFVTRIEGLTAEKAEVVARIKAEFEQAAGVGFDKRALKQILKERAGDSAKSVEHRAVVETYRRALGNLAGTPLGDWARGWMADSERHKMRSSEASSVLDDWMAKAKAKASESGDDSEAE